MHRSIQPPEKPQMKISGLSNPELVERCEERVGNSPEQCVRIVCLATIAWAHGYHSSSNRALLEHPRSSASPRTRSNASGNFADRGRWDTKRAPDNGPGWTSGTPELQGSRHSAH
ncbi:unnamed protein product [Gongylonema pulchrum]|uniref:Uncharacterized protein n=1 Tax=Gongylonema pulchrum TaxID=637853 RepID=A0A183D522_9BILA|nr:unnamed protein product [Gongylonema pulchrum]